MPLLYNPIFMARRLIFAFLIVFLEDYAITQLQYAVMSSALFIIYLNLCRPYIFSKMTRSEIMNEVINLVVTYHYLLFTNFVDDIEMRFYIGWSSIGLTILLISINMLIILKDFLYNIYEKKCKTKVDAWRARK